MLIRSGDEVNWSVRVRQPVIAGENVRGHDGIKVSDVWCYMRADTQSGMGEGNGRGTYLRLDRKSGL